jgi:hypothetical protein
MEKKRRSGGSAKKSTFVNPGGWGSNLVYVVVECPIRGKIKDDIFQLV